MSKCIKQNLFNEESDEEVTFKTETDYAKKYDKWREKEEIHKLEQKYGPNALDSDAPVSSDSEDDSDEPPEVSEESEAQFLKTLSLLKTKDPRIYDPGYQFFEEKSEKELDKETTSKNPKSALTFDDSDDDDDNDDGNIFTIEKKAEIGDEKQDKASTSKKAKTGKLKEYLSGQATHVDEQTERELAPLRALWSDPLLGEGEAFLRDYILNQKYLDEGPAGEAEARLRDDEDLEEDAKRVEEQGHFERAYNFRFEEPDEEYLKRFPRTMNYVRPKDARRSRKRAELRERKLDEKRRKMEDIGRLKALKLKEIHEKLARIREVTGNEDLPFKEEDIEDDFDPAEHDRRMRAVFDEQFYGDADVEKPVFPDLDEELEIENWDKFEPENERAAQDPASDDEPHCEDQEFNMDADYDPKRARATLLEEIKSNLGSRRRHRKKKSKLASLLSNAKPTYVPLVDEKTYSQHMEEYYKMDCEDVIGGDLPTRFKYRDVVPNDFGLSIEEILLADDKELTQWVPLKKLVRLRPTDVERGDVATYRQKAADASLKRKILPSLFKELPEEPELVVPFEDANKKKKKKKKKSKDKKEQTEQSIDETEQDKSGNISQSNDTQILDDSEVVHKKKKKKHKETDEYTHQIDENNVNESSEFVHKKKKNKHKDIEEFVNPCEAEVESSSEIVHKKKKKHKKIEENTNHNNQQQIDKGFEVIDKKKKLKDVQIFNDSNIKETIKTDPKKKKYEETDTSERNLDTSEKFNNKQHKRKKNKELKSTESSMKVNENIDNSKEMNKKQNLQRIDGFIVETIQKEEPSQGNVNDLSTHNVKKKTQFTAERNNMKHKLNTKNVEVPSKTKKNKNIGNKSKINKSKDFKTKFKQKEKFKSKQGKVIPSDNPLGNLSDERLKAYGLNPKKYRSFLKYKKF